MQYTALCALATASCIIGHFCSGVAHRAVECFKSSTAQTTRIVFHPITVFGTLQRQERHVYFPPEDLGRGPDQPTDFSWGERSQTQLALLKT